MKYSIITFGCQMNISDSERIAAAFESRNIKPASDIKEADFIIINMCSVRQMAVDRIFGLKKKFKNLKAKTILTGCFLEREKRKLGRIFDFILDIKALSKWPMLKRKQENYLNIIPKYQGNITANVPIMTGCNNYCSYCVVPYTRQREISRKVEEIISEIRLLIEKGFKEIWLLGQNVNSYKDNEIDFPRLLRLVNDIKGNFWIRFTSSHPKDFSNDLIKAMKDCKKATPYLNLPIQSGDDNILKKMNRPYTIKHYKTLIKKVRKAIPGIAISTDVIVGFPSETKKQFKNTKKAFEDIKYDMAYISEYSQRKGTTAEKLKDNVKKEEKKKRKKELNDILIKTAFLNNKKLVGKTIEFLPVKFKDNYLSGKSFQYKTIKVESKKDLTGMFLKVKVTKAFPWGLKGSLK